MNPLILLKILITTFLFFAMSVSIKAQQNKKPLQILPSVGMPIQFLNKDIYSGKPLNFSQQFGLEFKKQLSSKFSISLEGQYGIFSLKQNINKTYAAFIKNDSLSNYHQSTFINGIVNFSYSLFSKSRKNLFEMAIGGGIQQLNQEENILKMRNPFQGNTLTTVYHDLEGKYISPIGQLTMQNTFYIKDCIGISLGFKAQYSKSAYTTTYKKMPPTTDGQLAYEQFINSKDIETKQQRSFTLIPFIGIRFHLGSCKPIDQNKGRYSCFSLQWLNSTINNSCYNGDTLKFKITQPYYSITATGYEIYIAPINNLNNQHYLFSLPYPSTNFYISSILLDADKEYAVIVKGIDKDKKKICLQYIKPVKRCADCCKDVKLPE